MADWVKVDNFVAEIKEEPWSLYWKEWKSGSEEFEKFLHDPLPVLVEQIEECQKDWKVTTEILNHHAGFLGTAVCSTGMFVPSSKSAKITLYKH